MENCCLIVDDNSVNLMIVSNMMKHFEIDADVARSGAEAIRMAGEKEYDIIFMDYLMPELNGIETTREIRKWNKGKKAAVIALTANITEDVVSGFKEAGADEVTAKPMKMDSLNEIMEKWVPYIQKKKTDDKKEAGGEKKKSMEWLRGRLKELSMDTEHGALRLSDDASANYSILSASVRDLSNALWHVDELKKVTLWKEMRLDFHSMKGIFANLGVRGLSLRCGEIEMFAAEGSIDKIKANVPELIDEINGFITKFSEILKEWRQEEEGLDKDVKQVSREEWVNTLNNLKESLRCFEINNVDDYFQMLYTSANKDEEQILRRANSEMQDFRYDKALGILEEIKIQADI